MNTESEGAASVCRVVVGSMNAAKQAAVEHAFVQAVGAADVEGVTVPGAPVQPRTDAETLAGAEYRARAARAARPDAEYWVGVEGGVEPIGEKLMVIAWVVIMAGSTVGKSRSAAYELPAAAAAFVNAGGTLGEVSARVDGEGWKRRGLIATLSMELITRESFYVQPVVLALLPFLKPWHEIDAGANG